MKRRANKRNISSLFVVFLGGIASSLLMSYFDYKKKYLYIIKSILLIIVIIKIK